MKRKAIKGLKELEAAERRTRGTGCKFVTSCRAFMEKRGFLTAKQIHALTFAGTPNRRERQFSPWGGDDEQEPGYFDDDFVDDLNDFF